MTWVLGAALLGLILSLRKSRDGLRRLRRPQEVADASLVWEEPSRATWQEDAVIGAALSLTTLGTLALGVLVSLDGARYWPVSEFWLSGRFSLILQATVLLSIWLVWYLTGAQVGFELFNLIISPVRMGIYPDGIFSGQFNFDWTHFSHFSADEGTRLINVYGRECPELPIVACKPTSVELYHQIKHALAAHLPASQPGLPVPWRRRKWTLALSLAGQSILAVLFGYWLYSQHFFTAWALQAFLAWVVVFNSGRLMQSFTGTRSMSPEPEAGG